MSMDIPVVLFIFRRKDTLKAIIGRIALAAPKKVYLLSDGPRTEEERHEVEQCRKTAQALINWDCEVVGHFAENNIGVYQNIGEGAKWIFQHEKQAIFLEDDNLPEVSFFSYCSELLNRYKDNPQILWICGTNYLGKCGSPNGYYFTKHLLPCGWASWSDKFTEYYDGLLTTFQDAEKQRTFKHSYKLPTYKNVALYKQQLYSVGRTAYLLNSNKRQASWDFQMLFSLRANGLYGIAPAHNQIKNIGVDAFSAHGGNSMSLVMTKRFCGMDSFPLTTPLRHPVNIDLDPAFEKKIGDIILPPLRGRIKRNCVQFAKQLLGIPQYDSLVDKIKRKK